MMNLEPFPHCDAAILHKPGECDYCDRHPQWQQLREAWGIAFTGHAPVGHQQPCPSDARRGRHGGHGWAGNRPTNVPVPVPETPASRSVYRFLRRFV